MDCRVVVDCQARVACRAVCQVPEAVLAEVHPAAAAPTVLAVAREAEVPPAES